MKNNHGQGVVESLLSLPVVILAVSAILFLCYRSVVFYCADYFLHEALICSDARPARHCEIELQSRMMPLLPKGSPFKINLARSTHKVRGYVEVRFPFIAENFGPPVVLEKQLQLPIKGETTWRQF